MFKHGCVPFKKDICSGGWLLRLSSATHPAKLLSTWPPLASNPLLAFHATYNTGRASPPSGLEFWVTDWPPLHLLPQGVGGGVVCCCVVAVVFSPLRWQACTCWGHSRVVLSVSTITGLMLFSIRVPISKPVLGASSDWLTHCLIPVSCLCTHVYCSGGK